MFPERIKALGVHKSIKSCTTVTVAEFWNEQDGIWEEIRDSEYVETNFDESQMYFDYSVDQKLYLDTFIDMYGYYETDSGEIPEYVAVYVQFRTYDISNPNNAVVDPITIYVYSSGELPSAFCDFTLLQIDINTAMSGDRMY
jgi:hypothetical protein